MSQYASSTCMEYELPPHLEPHLGSLRVVLGNWLTEARSVRLAEVAAQRTRRVMSVFEDTHHSHNVSAVLRTADAFGFQDATFVFQEHRRHARVKDCVERGSSNWLTLRRATSIESCGRALREAGYAVALVTLPTFFISARHYRADLPSFSAEELAGNPFWDFLGERRLALIFGNEADGLSENWVQHADCYCHIGMHGFVESLNLSVTAGILLQALRGAINSRIDAGLDFCLTEDERLLLIDQWTARSSTKGACLIEKEAPELLEYYKFILRGDFFRPFRQCG